MMTYGKSPRRAGLTALVMAVVLTLSITTLARATSLSQARVHISSHATVGSGTLIGSLEPPAATVNLTSEGTADWAHWGLNTASSFDHKNGVVSRISNYSVVGNGTVRSYLNDPTGYSWSDGTPTVSATNTTTGVHIAGTHNGFKISVATDMGRLNLKVYVGVQQAQGTFSATVNDANSSSYTDATINNAQGITDGVYTLNYVGNAQGQILTVTFTMKHSYTSSSRVSLQAATLGFAPVMDPVPPTLISSVSTPGSSVNLTSEGTADWAHWGLNSASSFDHRASITGLISNYTPIGNVPATRYTNNSTGYSWVFGTPTASATNTTTGLSITGTGNGFQVTVPANQFPRVLKIYVGVQHAQGSFTAALSDHSVAPYTDTSLNSPQGSIVNGVYTLVYAARSSGQTLTVAFTLRRDYGSGQVTLQSATLQ